MTITWHTEKRKLSDLIPANYNPRKISDQQRNQIYRSLHKFGYVETIDINLDNTVIGGHQRLNAMADIGGYDDIDVRVPDRALTKKEEKELNLRLNKNTGEFDYDLLGSGDFELDMLQDVGFDDAALQEISGHTEEKLIETEQEVKFYKKTHVLISIPIDKIIEEITTLLSTIKKIDGVEFEQSSN